MRSTFSMRVFCCALGFSLLLAAFLIMKGKISIDIVRRSEIEVVEP